MFAVCMLFIIMYSIHLLGCYVQFNKYTLNMNKTSLFHSLSLSADEFILVACGQRILSGNVDGTNFEVLYTHTGSQFILDLDFDPVSDKILFNEGGNIHSVDPDGSNYQLLLEVNGK